MTTAFEKRISRLVNSSPAKALWGGLKGVEKEALRVNADGMLSNEPHPKALGSALSNRFITTDFSESLLEFVTPAFSHTWETLRFLCDIHQFTYQRLDDELLWATSMPCRLPEEERIPLAQYGSSNVARMKTIYRRGLGYRYGRKMQAIAGLHFNYSLPETFWTCYQDNERESQDPVAFRSDAYLGLIRNCRRFGWLVLYLFGASPAVCRSFIGGAHPGLVDFDAQTLYQPFATSLRMSDLGYSNRTQARINISLNSLDEYVTDLVRAINTLEPAFEKIGVKVNGEYRQLSANLLQIENEYYSPIRPKRVAYSGERPTAALERGGIEYVEVRSLDLNVFDPTGINQNVMRFMEAFLVYCLISDSPRLDDAGWDEAAANQLSTARRGRDPELRLMRNGKAVTVTEWGNDILSGTRAVAELIDRGDGGQDYASAVDAQAALIQDADSTPSARLLEELRTAGCSFFDFAMQAARGHRDYFRSIAPLSVEREAEFTEEAESSLLRQLEIEQSDTLSLDEYLANYFAGT
ncbi:MAG TPA: glutamate--cysteine ligase [Woeseiaceae bacterium]|nr:glutamate--cysteine ligase [Woeseiaceae bacterium]